MRFSQWAESSVAILLTSRSDGLYLEAIIVKNHAAIEEILVRGIRCRSRREHLLLAASEPAQSAARMPARILLASQSFVRFERNRQRAQDVNLGQYACAGN